MLSENDMDHAETESTADAEPARAGAPEETTTRPDQPEAAAAAEPSVETGDGSSAPAEAEAAEAEAVDAEVVEAETVEAVAAEATEADPHETAPAEAVSLVESGPVADAAVGSPAGTADAGVAAAEAASDAELVAAAEPAAAAPEGGEPEPATAPVVAADFALRMAEALIFASASPLTEAQLAERLPEGTDLRAILAQLAATYAERGVNLMSVAGGWAFRTAPDLAAMLRTSVEVPRKLSRAAMEALAIIAYHQPVTRGEIEEIRGVALSKGTLDVLLEIGWIKPRGRKQTPGRPAMWGTTDEFLNHFGLASVEDLPGVEELKAAGLLDRRPAMTTLAMRDAEKGDAPDAAETEEAEVRAEREAAAIAEMDGAPAEQAAGEPAPMADAEAIAEAQSGEPGSGLPQEDPEAAVTDDGDVAAVAALEADAEAGRYEETDEDEEDDDDPDEDYDDEDDDYDDDEDGDGGAQAGSIAAAAAIEEPV